MSLNDPYVDLDGLCEGGPSKPYKWSTIILNNNFSEYEWRQINNYIARTREFFANIYDVGVGSRRLNLLNDESTGKIQITDANYPGRHRAKSLYLDFRHFINQREPSHFNKVINTVKKQFTEKNMLDFFEAIKKNFDSNNPMISSFTGNEFSTNQYIDDWFNVEFFHSSLDEKAERIKELLLDFDAEGAQHLLFSSVISRSSHIRLFYACIKDMYRAMENASLIFNCPDQIVVEKMGSKYKK